jgi:hypothetical protein
MSDLTIRCTCGVYLHSTELSAEQILDMVKTWSGHLHEHDDDRITTVTKEDTP